MFDLMFKEKFVPFMMDMYGISVDAKPTIVAIDDLYYVYARKGEHAYTCSAYYDDLCNYDYLFNELKNSLVTVFSSLTNKEDKN